ncbi:predicted protein [Coccidioides posadasii str. Silveira]|uniref:Predicted protein n=1 Tax=Coccidioides posadasii (strain RMSCC 757 / Silveira) TaxID=443226 RepID=E9DAN3_COCPS|nr:predicted protein [Coccidioides posadasii str. Silveira]
MDTTSGGMVPPSNGTFDQGGSQSNDLNKLEGKASDFVSSGPVDLLGKWREGSA